MLFLESIRKVQRSISVTCDIRRILSSSTQSPAISTQAIRLHWELVDTSLSGVLLQGIA